MCRKTTGMDGLVREETFERSVRTLCSWKEKMPDRRERRDFFVWMKSVVRFVAGCGIRMTCLFLSLLLLDLVLYVLLLGIRILDILGSLGLIDGGKSLATVNRNDGSVHSSVRHRHSVGSFDGGFDDRRIGDGSGAFPSGLDDRRRVEGCSGFSEVERGSGGGFCDERGWFERVDGLRRAENG